LLLIVTDGCAGLAAIQTVYRRARHQRCWVHKMGTLLEHVRKCDYDEVKAQISIYSRRIEGGQKAESGFRRKLNVPLTSANQISAIAET